MPKTIDKTYEGQIIGGIFTNRDDADGAIEALEELEISSDDIEEFVQLDNTQSKEAHNQYPLRTRFFGSPRPSTATSLSVKEIFCWWCTTSPIHLPLSMCSRNIRPNITPRVHAICERMC
jgi:hypothetical protein